MAAKDNLGDQFNRGGDIEVCEGCGATTDWAKETYPSNPVEGGLCENCFSGMPTGALVTPIMGDNGKASWAKHSEHRGQPYIIKPEHMN